MLSVLPAAMLVLSLTLTGIAWAQAPAPLVQTANTPPQVGAALVIAPPGGLCRELVTQFSTTGGPRGDLRDRCTELVQNANKGGQSSAVQSGLEEMAGAQQTALGTGKLKRALQFSSITSRLAELRGGPGVRVGLLPSDGQDGAPGPLLASLAGTQFAAATDGTSSSPPASGRLGVFLNGSYTTGDVDATSREAGFDYNVGGVTAGVDYRLTSTLVLGAAFSYAGTSADFSGSGGKVDVDDFAGSLYGTYYVSDDFYVDGIFSAGFNSYSLSRRIVYSIPTVPSVGTGITNVNQTATSDTDGMYFAIGVGGAYDFHFGGFTVGPTGRVNYLHTKVDGYTETINGTGPGVGLALQTDSQTIESLVTSLGVQASYAISTPIGVLLPQLAFEWQHEFLNNARSIKARFVNDPTPSGATTIQWDTDSPDRDYFTLGAGVSMNFAHGIAAFAYYETILGLSGVTEQRVTGGVRMTF